MSRTVLFVDDDRRLVRVYAEAAMARGLMAHCVYGPDAALAYLREGGAAEVIVWDMMMAPGTELGDEDTAGGLLTGRSLYQKMRALRPGSTYVLLTNLDDNVTMYERPEERSYGRSKISTPPEALATFLDNCVPDPSTLDRP